MDREHGTERLADASFLEELLRGRRAVVLTFGDPAPAQHLARRLGTGITLVDGSAAPGVRDGSVDAVVALGGFQDDLAIDGLIAEARRLLAPGGFFAASWIDPLRATLEAMPQAASRPALAPKDAARRLQARFAVVAVVARQPYLGFQYVSGVDAQGALTLDSSLTAGGAEAPSGFLALASDAPLPFGDALIQVPYDKAVARVAQWMREAPGAAPAAPSYRQTVQRPTAAPRESGDESERLRGEGAALRERAQLAVEEADRARGEARSAKERATLLEAEVAKLKGRIKGIPEAEAEKLRAEIAARTRERDAARKDAEGAAGEAARVLEAAANLEREVDFLQGRVTEAERESETLRSEKARAEEDAGMRLRDARADVKAAKAELEKARAESAKAAADLAAAKQAAAAAAEREKALGSELKSARAQLEKAADTSALEAAQKRAKDFEDRFRDANAKLQVAVQKASDLEGAKIAAERAAEDAWKRVKEAQAAPAAPPGDMVPASDLEAVQRTLADAIARAEAAEKAKRIQEEAPGEAAAPSGEIREMEKSLRSLRDELAAVRRRADQAEARAVSLDRVAEDAKAKLELATRQAGGGDAEGLRSLLHQRETALSEARAQAQSAEARVARFSTEAAEAIQRLRSVEEQLAGREAELKKALSGLDGVEQREQRDRELLAELKGEIARLTEANAAARDELARVHAGGGAGGAGADAVARERDEAVQAAGMAQAEAARAHAEADALRERLAAAEKDLATLKSSGSKSDEQNAERERRIADLEAKLLQLKAAGDSTSEMERRSVAMSQKLAHLEAELERAQADVKQATAEARKYRALAEAIEPPADSGRGRT